MQKVIFMGTPEFSVPTLAALIAEPSVEVSAVVTQPDRKVGRKQIKKASPVKQLALEHGLTVLQPEHLGKSAELEQLIELQPDLIVTAAYGQFVPTRLLEAPTFGAVNIHASLLPKYRGAAPIHYAVMNGDEETGVTLMYMVKEMDAGNMIAKRAVPIEPTDDTGTLFDELSGVGRDLLIETLPSIWDRTNPSVPQDEALVSYSPRISRAEEQIDWVKDARAVHFLVRALRPRPGAYTVLDGERFKIWDTEISSEKTNATPGTIIKLTKDAIHVAAGEGTVLALTAVQPSGKKRMDVTSYLLGAQLEEGMTFDEI